MSLNPTSAARNLWHISIFKIQAEEMHAEALGDLRLCYGRPSQQSLTQSISVRLLGEKQYISK